MNDIAFIHLANGGFSVVDFVELPKIPRVKWDKTTLGYAWYHPSRNVIVWLHRLINGTPDGIHTDHINGNKLDNRRCNLRTATPSQNQANATKTNIPRSSRFKGVTWDQSRDTWKASIKVHYRTINLGRFNIEEDAALAYNKSAVEHFGAFARVNEL